jgi:hypothetical protein
VNTEQLGVLLAESAVLAERSVGDDWAEVKTKLGTPVLGPAARLASSGQLEQALRALEVEPRLARAAQTWPKVLATARYGLDDLPRLKAAQAPLVTLAVYCALLCLVQLASAALLSVKVVPVLAAMGAELHLGTRGTPGDALRVLVPLQLVLWALVAWFVRSPRAWWNADLGLAAHATIAAGLLSADAPKVLVAGWLAEEPRLGIDSQHRDLRDDLRAVATSLGHRAEARLKRFVVVVRVGALALVTAQGLWVLAAVYGQLSTLAGAL